MGTSSNSFQLFNKENLHTLIWPSSEQSVYAKKFLEPLISNGISLYCNNIKCTLYALQADGHTFPVVAAKSNYDNAYVCSPFGHYISYAKEACLSLTGNRLQKLALKGFLDGVGLLGRLGQMNSAVFVNNWLFSTDLYPKGMNEKLIPNLLPFLCSQFPEQAIIFRSINSKTTPNLSQSLAEQQFKLIPSRQIYITDADNPLIFTSRIIKSDLKLLEKADYEISEPSYLSPAECSLIADLYHSIYIDSHSTLNPQFNHTFMELAHQNSLLSFKILKSKDQGSILGVAGYHERDGIMFCPIFGYNKEHPDHASIYRLLSISLLLEAKKRNSIFHQSSGASFYKTIRKAESCLEYMAVYSKHLSLHQRAFWSGFSILMNKYAPNYMEKY